MAVDVSALEDLLERLRSIVGKDREKKLSALLEKRRRQWRKDCRKRNVPVPKVTYKPVEVDVLTTKEQLFCELESSVEVLAETRKKMLEDVRVMETSRLGKLLDNTVSDISGSYRKPRDRELASGGWGIAFYFGMRC